MRFNHMYNTDTVCPICYPPEKVSSFDDWLQKRLINSANVISKLSDKLNIGY